MKDISADSKLIILQTNQNQPQRYNLHNSMLIYFEWNLREIREV